MKAGYPGPGSLQRPHPSPPPRTRQAANVDGI